MKFALFTGCKIPYFVPQYETASRMVLREFGVELVDIEFNCCGYPVHHLDFNSFILSSARNLALAEKEGLDILTPCKCCFGSLKKAGYLLKEHDTLRNEVNASLKEDGLEYEGTVEAKHLLSVLFHEVGLDGLREKVTRPYRGLKIATHYGCHALRPGNVTQFDDPVAPTKFDQLVEVTGAESVDWPMKLQCCGNPLLGKNDALSRDLTEKKLVDGKQAGAHCLCVACTYCQIQFDTVQKQIVSEKGNGLTLPSILYPQLLGLSMGMEGEELGITMNEMALDGIANYLS